ncbi:DNA-binding domain-containing protein [Saccharicrinis aurantiacus]|uniref:DNA-binding domain-containing protein n=1 Tax=Saccharicrinis aurantiacus TaxID=1849719 RepID=UPI000838C441|nr:DNA-binding domain-containing protein [Saccharicrinis aurantiacus]
MIKYSLFKNHFTQAEKDCVVFIQERRTITLPETIETMTGRGKSITDTQVLSVLNEFSHVVSEHLKQGDSISTVARIPYKFTKQYLIRSTTCDLS